MIDPRLVDIQFAPDGMIEQSARSEETGLMGAGAVEFPNDLRIGRSEWSDRIVSMKKHGAWAEDYSDHTTHQGPRSHECVAHATSTAFSICYCRQIGKGNAVWFSPLALYTRITGGRQWGGSVVQDALYEMIEAGAIPEHDGAKWMGGEDGQRQRMKHTLHRTSGFDEPFVKPRDLPSGWEKTAKHFRVLECYLITDPESHFSALLSGWPVVSGRSGHSICHVSVELDGKRYLSKYQDSYDRWLYDSERMTGNGFCIRSTTHPHDPERPAGSQMK